jgi:hypothetical protein
LIHDGSLVRAEVSLSDHIFWARVVDFIAGRILIFLNLGIRMRGTLVIFEVGLLSSCGFHLCCYFGDRETLGVGFVGESCGFRTKKSWFDSRTSIGGLTCTYVEGILRDVGLQVLLEICLVAVANTLLGRLLDWEKMKLGVLGNSVLYTIHRSLYVGANGCYIG